MYLVPESQELPIYVTAANRWDVHC
jgi:hypothetical protein